MPEDKIYTSAARLLAVDEVVPRWRPPCRSSAAGNFSVSGEVGSLVEPCPDGLKHVALRSAAALSLRVAGVDLFVESVTNSDDPEIRVVEVNGNPGIRSLENLGRFDLIERIWCEVLRKGLAESVG